MTFIAGEWSIEEIIAFLDRTCGEAFLYGATDEEIEALRWIGARYTVSELLLGAVSDDGAIYMDPAEVSSALAADGIDRVPCLDEATTLAKLVWCIGPDRG